MRSTLASSRSWEMAPSWTAVRMGPVGCLQVLGQEQDVRPRLEGQQSGLARFVPLGDGRVGEGVGDHHPLEPELPRSFWVIIS